MSDNTAWKATAEVTSYPPLTEDVEADVCVVGGGITGVTTAYLLQEQGRRVVLLDAARIGSGVTGHTSGHLTSLVDAYYHNIISKYGEGEAKQLADATTEARKLVERLIADNALDAGYERVPGYYFMSDEDQRESFDREREALGQVGMDVQEAELDELPLKAIDAMKVPDQAVINALHYAQGLVKAFERNGGRVYEQSMVEDFGSEGDKVRIKTEQGSVLANKLVQATHTPLKINPIQLELRNFNSYVLAGESRRSVKKGLFYDFAEPYHYIRNFEEDGKKMFIVGGYDNKTGSGDNEQRSMEKLFNYSQDELAVENITYKWSSMLFTPSDDLPFIGKDPVHLNSYIATGFAGDGLTFGLVSGILLSALITEGSHPWEKLFDPVRFNLSSLPDMLRKNVSFAKHLVGDRLSLNGAEIEEIKMGEGKILNLNDGKKVGVYVDKDGGAYGVKPVCPHMKCILHWNSVATTWDCGCHGSRFDKLGNLVSGPSTEKLERVDISEAERQNR